MKERKIPEFIILHGKSSIWKHQILIWSKKGKLGCVCKWGALSKIYPETRHQRCWVHKTANVLNKLPKSMQPKVKASLHEIWMAEKRENAYKAFDNTIALYSAKYPKAIECLAKDKEELLAFYDFPAEHWIHIRTTNPIESAFATVRLRIISLKTVALETLL